LYLSRYRGDERVDWFVIFYTPHLATGIWPVARDIRGDEAVVVVVVVGE
jgi:hypothetical protein